MPYRWLVAGTAAFIFLAAYFVSLAVHVDFLKGESGFALALTGNPAVVDYYLNLFLRSSYNGHYTPIAFAAEYAQGQMLGTWDRGWLFRQLLAVAMLFAATFSLIARVFESSGRSRYLLGIAVGALICLMPPMLEMITFPFMIMQLICMVLALVSTVQLLHFARTLRAGDLFKALVAAYAAMHFFGVGLAVSASAIATSVALITLSRAWSARLASLIAVFSGLTLAHAYMMLRVSTPGTGPSIQMSFIAAHFGSYFLNALDEGLKALWTGLPRLRSYEELNSDNAYGYVLWLALLGVLVGAVRSHIRQKTENREAIAFFLFWLGFASLYVLMIVARLDQMELPFRGLLLVGPRYLFFGGMLAIMLVVGLIAIVALPQRLPWGIIAALTIGVAVLDVRDAGLLASMVPAEAQSHSALWRQVRQEARDGLAQNRPIEDIALPLEFPLTAKNFEGLIRKDLAVSAATNFRWIPAQQR